MAIFAPGTNNCNSLRMLASGRLTQPAVGTPLLQCMKIAEPAPFTISFVLYSIIAAYL